jgi:response regulator RpfG family c-di-GMP phosphodiesterase
MTKRPTILIVENETLNLESVRSAVSAAGYEAVVTDSAMVSLVVARESLPSLIIYPAEGAKLVPDHFKRLLHDNPLTAHIPVLLLNGSEKEIDVTAAVQSSGKITAEIRRALVDGIARRNSVLPGQR